MTAKKKTTKATKTTNGKALVNEMNLVTEEVKRDDKLKELAGTIKTELDSAQRSFLKVGKCLTHALDAIKENGGKQKDFIKWADENCQIKKAQSYKLMKVYKEFGDQSDFAGVSMRVLYTLTSLDADTVEQARELSLKGKLDSKALDKLLESSAPAPEKNSSESTGKPAKKFEEKAEAKAKAEVKPENKDSKENEALKKELAELKKSKGADDSEKVIQGLNSTVEALRSTISELQAELKEAKTAKKKKEFSIPELPQFDSNCMATRLGLELDNAKDKVKINKAYRSLAKIFTATSAPKAAEKLKTARNELLNSINKS